MSQIVTTKVGRFRHVTPDAWLWECPCGQWSYLTTDQWAGRVSVDHASQGCPVKYHETHNYEAELVVTMQARILTGEPPIDPVSPVEPEPPTEAQFGEYDRLKRQAREIEKALREAGCPAMPLEQGVRWLADKDFTAPLPPRPPAVVKPHRYDLVRYGVTWEGQSNQPLLTPMPDGYWTPWHLAVEAPTVKPEPCVWRAIATVPKDGTRILLTPAVWTAERVVSAYYRLGMWWIESADARGSIRAFTDPDEDASHWPFTHWTPLPGAPLKVEREP